MANTNTTSWTDFVEGALDLEAALYLTDKPSFRAFCDKRPARQAHPGDIITLSIHNQLAQTTATLDENTDVTPVAMPAPRRVQVELFERGNVVQHTEKLAKLAFTQTVASDLGFQIGENMHLSLDDVYRLLFDTADNVLWVNDTDTIPGDTDPGANRGTLTSKAVAAAVAVLRGRRAPERGKGYAAVVHPDVSFDLRLEVGDTAWQNPHQYVDTAEIYAGEIGRLHGARFVENPRSTVTEDATNGNVYNTYMFGREAAVEAVATEPHVRVGPVVDKLKRFFPVGWYGLLGQSLYRQNSLQLVKTVSDLETISSAADFDGSA
jgi:N4-gp56 family major capsid protein